MPERALTPIAEELRQTRPFPTLEAEVLVSLLRTSDRVRGVLADVMSPFGVTLQQYNVLRILRGAGPDGLPTLAIGDRMIERTPGVTRLLDRLERQGLISRSRGEDRRQVIARVTAAGLEALEAIEAPLRGAHLRLLSTLDDEDGRRLLDLLARIRAGAAGAESGEGVEER